MKDAVGTTIYSEVPALDKLQRATEMILRTLFINKIPRIIWDMIYFVIVAVIFTRELRLLAGNLLVSILIIGILLIFFFTWSRLLVKFIIPKLSYMVLGPPVFGKLGGIQRKTFFTGLKCADAICFKFRPADLERVKDFNKFDRDIIEQTLKHNYEVLLCNESKTVEKPIDFLEKWSSIWQKKILKLSTKNSAGETLTFDDSLAEENFASRIEPLKLQTVSSLVAPTIIALQVVMIIFINMFLSNQINLVTVIQVGLFFSFIVSLLLFNFHAHQNAEVPFVGIAPDIPEEVAKTFVDRARNIGGEPFRPSKVTIKKPYLPLIRDYFAVILFWFGGVLNACTSLLLVGLTLLLGFILQYTNMSKVLTWYKDMAIGLSLMPFGILACYYVAFLTLQYARMLLAPIIVGLLAAVLPYGLGYLFTGQINLTQIQNAVWATVTGILASLVTVITSQVKSTLKGENGK